MTTANIVSLVVTVAIAALLVVRQMRARPVYASFRIPLILGLIGLIELVNYLQRGHTGTGVILGLAGSLVLAAVFGAVRASTVRLWLRDGQPWRKGTWLTAVLWAVSLAAHYAFDELVARSSTHGNLAGASILLYLAVTYTVQRLIVQARAQRIPAPDSKVDSLA